MNCLMMEYLLELNNRDRNILLEVGNACKFKYNQSRLS